MGGGGFECRDLEIVDRCAVLRDRDPLRPFHAVALDLPREGDGLGDIRAAGRIAHRHHGADQLACCIDLQVSRLAGGELGLDNARAVGGCGLFVSLRAGGLQRGQGFQA